MILDNAPDVLLFNLEQPLSDTERDKLKSLSGLLSLTSEQSEQANLLKEKETVLEDIWIPLPLDSRVIPVQIKAFQSSTTKRLQQIEGESVLTNTGNLTTITITSPGNVFVNLLVGVADFFFQQEDSLPRIRFFSNKAVIIDGRLFRMGRSYNANTDEQTVVLEIQKGDAGAKLTKVKKKTPIELTPLPDIPIEV